VYLVVALFHHEYLPQQPILDLTALFRHAETAVVEADEAKRIYGADAYTADAYTADV
jgi:hypothetical protein